MRASCDEIILKIWNCHYRVDTRKQQQQQQQKEQKRKEKNYIYRHNKIWAYKIIWIGLDRIFEWMCLCSSQAQNKYEESQSL